MKQVATRVSARPQDHARFHLLISLPILLVGFLVPLIGTPILGIDLLRAGGDALLVALALFCATYLLATHSPPREQFLALAQEFIWRQSIVYDPELEHALTLVAGMLAEQHPNAATVPVPTVPLLPTFSPPPPPAP